MSITKKTFTGWLEMNNRLPQVENLDPGKPGYVNDKWTYCAKKNAEKIAKELQKVQLTYKTKVEDFKEDLLISYASTNEKGELVPGGFHGYSFKSESMKEFNIKSREFERQVNDEVSVLEIEIDLYKLTDENCERIKLWDTFTKEYFQDLIPSSYMENELAESIGMELVK